MHDGKKSVFQCRAKGIFRNQKIKPLVGDDVEFSVLDLGTLEGNIEKILPRKNLLSRPTVANIDQVLIFFALTQPEPNLNLLDRCLVSMEMEGIPVCIGFNKADLCTKDRAEACLRIYQKAGYPVLMTSAKEGIGMEEIRRFIRGKTTALSGPSGVGKSSLTNYLQPDAQMETGEISGKIKRGKHTTRHSQLFYVEENTFIMDTPGFSSLYMQDMEAKDLKQYFPEFSAFEKDCQFLDCIHLDERICGVKKALEEAKISKSRYENYCLLYQELKTKRRF